MKKVLIATANAKSTPEARAKPHVWPIKKWFIIEYPYFLDHVSTPPTAHKSEHRRPLAGRLKNRWP